MKKKQSETIIEIDGRMYSGTDTQMFLRFDEEYIEKQMEFLKYFVLTMKLMTLEEFNQRFDEIFNLYMGNHIEYRVFELSIDTLIEIGIIEAFSGASMH